MLLAVVTGLIKAKYVGERKVNLFGIFLPFREVMTTSLTHEWNTNPDPHGLDLPPLSCCSAHSRYSAGPSATDYRLS